MAWKNYITADPQILFGKPVIKNTRIPVDLVLEKLSAGHSIESLLKAYPRLTKKLCRPAFSLLPIMQNMKKYFPSNETLSDCCRRKC